MVVLGGTHDVMDLKSALVESKMARRETGHAPNNLRDIQSVLDRTLQLVPALEKSILLGTWASFRPERPRGIVLHSETILGPSNLKAGNLAWDSPGNSRKRKFETVVVHNYGHGGCGLTLHWGCALQAARLVQMAMAKGQAHDRPTGSKL